MENKVDDLEKVAAGLRDELARCQRELDACRTRMGDMGQAEALIAGENRLLEMVAKGEALPLNVTEQKRAEVFVAGEKKLLEMIARGSSLSSVLIEQITHVASVAIER